MARVPVAPVPVALLLIGLARRVPGRGLAWAGNVGPCTEHVFVSRPELGVRSHRCGYLASIPD
jgi:hypothetical protein